MSELFCHNCGAAIGDDETFCRKCGTKRKTDIPSVPSDEAPEMEESKFCFNCGARIVSGGRFCHHCGVDQAGPAQRSARRNSQSNSHIQYRPSSPAKKRSVFRALLTVLLSAVLVAGVSAGAYLYFFSDIPWKDVKAVITGHKSEPSGSGGAVPVTPEEREAVGISADIVPSDDVSEGVLTAPEPASEDEYVPSADQSPPPMVVMLRYAWSQTDEKGFSRPVVINQSGVFVRDAVFTGTVLGNRVRVRSEPNTAAATLRHFNRDELLDVVGRYSSAGDRHFWFNVRVDGQPGWMYGEFLRVIESPRTP